MVNPVASTVTVAPEMLISVAFIVGLVVPIPTGPKFTGDTATKAGIGVPWIGAVCVSPGALSVTLRVALLTALPGGFAAV
jgi:hypothetical protein